MNEVGNSPIFVTVKKTVKATGVPERLVREWLRAGKIPHIKSGNKYLVNLPLFLAELESMSKRGAGE